MARLSPTPLVSVIIPAYNAGRLLDGALTALRRQTLPADRIQTIVIDDGSTDDTARLLEVSAADWPQLLVLRQPNSGRPSVGRNHGLRHATGRYVFFHDADDWLAPDALHRLTAAAERHHADVVVGRTVVVGGPGRAAARLRPAVDADLIADGVWASLAPHKLFRGSLLGRLELRFAEDVVQGEDQVFTAAALLAAVRVTTIGGPPVYFRRRGGDGHLSSEAQTFDNKVHTVTRLSRLIVDHVPPGQRSRYFDRVLLRALAPGLGSPFMAADPALRADGLRQLQREVLPQLQARHLDRANDTARLRLRVAAGGSAEDLVTLNAWLQRRRDDPRHGVVPAGGQADAEALRYDPPASLRALLQPDDLDLRRPRPTPLAAEVARSGAELRIRVDAGRWAALHPTDAELVGRSGRRNRPAFRIEAPAGPGGRIEFRIHRAALPAGRSGRRWWLECTVRHGPSVVAAGPLRLAGAPVAAAGPALRPGGRLDVWRTPWGDLGLQLRPALPVRALTRLRSAAIQAVRSDHLPWSGAR